jgi:hypothetical protein
MNWKSKAGTTAGYAAMQRLVDEGRILSRNQAVERSADAFVRKSTVPVPELSPDSAEAPEP